MTQLNYCRHTSDVGCDINGGQVSGYNWYQHHTADEHGGHTDGHQGTKQLHTERLCQFDDPSFLLHCSLC